MSAKTEHIVRLGWLVISTWVDAESWQKWQMVPERREIESKIEALLVAPEEVTILKIAGR